MSGRQRATGRARLRGIRVVSFDFGNTLVRVDRESTRRLNERIGDEVAAAWGLPDPAPFRVAWSEERDRQFREDVPEGRELDLEARARRVIARLRGMSPPPPGERWDDVAVASHSSPGEIAFAIESYSRGFVEGTDPSPDAEPCLRRLAADGFRLVILSNWPLAATIDRYVGAAGWAGLFEAIFVSQRIGSIKPDRAIFEHAEAAIGVPGEAILHVGDDWAADVVGAIGAGWHVAYLADRQGDTPLPTSARGEGPEPDLELAHLAELPDRLEPPA